MLSIVQRALGPRFAALHPELQRLYSLESTDAMACVRRGVMDEIRRGRFHVVPFLRLGALRRVMFAETGQQVPFTVWNYAYKDRFGRETLTLVREFHLYRVRRFDETLIYSERRQCAVAYAGTHQHLAVELALGADDDGSFRLRTGAQRLYEWPIGIRFPLLLSGRADVREWYNDSKRRFEVEVSIANPLLGPIFGYRGWFQLELQPCRAEDIPRDMKPQREEGRE